MAIALYVTDRSGDFLVELENANVNSMEWELNQPGALSFDIPVDDPKLVVPGATNMLTTNQADGGEAGNTTGFVTYGANTIASSTAQVFSGSRAIRVTVGATPDNRLVNFSPVPSFAAGTSYIVSVWVYIPTAFTGTAPFFSNDGAAGTPVWSMIEPADMSKRDQWQRISAEIVTSTSGSYNHIIRTTGHGSGQNIYFDRFQVELSSTKSGPSEWVAGGTTRADRYYPRGNIDEIQAWVDDELMWWGLLSNIQSNAQTSTVQCEGLLAYFHKRFVTTSSLTYTSLDQFTIAWNLINFAQTGADRSFNITNASYSPSGKVRSRLYERLNHDNIFDALQEFPGLELGFDFDIDIYGDGRREFHPFHPTKGSRKGAYPIEWGVNIKDFNNIEDFVEQANYVYATGGSVGDVKFENYYRDDTSAALYGEMQAMLSEGSQNDVDELEEMAQREVEARKDPVRLPTITTTDRAPFDMLKNVFTGDSVPVLIDHGRAYFQGDLRVAKKTWNPPQESISWDLVKVPA